TASAAAPKAAPQPAAPAPQAGAPSGNRLFASPLARRLAKEAGVDVGRIQGSGPHGRVIARDIEAAKSGKGLKPAALGTAPAAASIAPSMTDQQVRALFEEGSYEVVP